MLKNKAAGANLFSNHSVAYDNQYEVERGGTNRQGGGIQQHIYLRISMLYILVQPLSTIAQPIELCFLNVAYYLV